MTGTSHPGAVRRAAVACGLGVILAAVLAGPSSAALSPDPSPGDGGKKTATREEAGGKAAAGEKAGGRAAAGEKADAGKEAAGERDGGGKETGGKASAAKAAAGNVSAGNVPRLSISVDNGRTAAQEGDRLTYTVTVRNIGTAGARNLHLTQSLPPGLKFVSTDGHGAVRHGQIVWSADVRAGKDVTFHTTAKVQDTPDQLLRLATVACASTGADAKPIVCATHSDELPAGAAAAEAARLAANPATGTLRYVLMGIGLLIVAVAGTLVARRARRQARLRLPS
ncbi:DUF11 domain-containing protein [Streptosporangium sp. 'caverna']|uniref:DUF11 domain-containing protein n=1 Tax=Streptosporangium sp. 'caverna' TaxID=2202249 RepID=UPI000D7E4DEE|nr:DUF11 domain-containing protein [Streptosporangium sp. 'caverna']AWS40597.1 hypothetical protein DKM19_03815 [Streptosporangium sp. 'caverna']